MRGLISGVGLLLMAVIVGLGLLLHQQLDAPPPGRMAIDHSATPAASNEATDSMEQMPIERFELQALDSYSEIVQRPLFLATRRPPAKQSVAAKPSAGAPVEKPDYVLTGVMMTGDWQQAFLLSAADNKPRSVKQGEKLDGWLVHAVESRQVVLTRGDARVALKMQSLLDAAKRAGPVAATATRTRPATRAAASPAKAKESRAIKAAKAARAARATKAARSARDRRRQSRTSRRRSASSGRTASTGSTSPDPRNPTVRAELSPGSGRSVGSGSGSRSGTAQSASNTTPTR